MNKLFTKIVGVALGLTMAIGVGVAVGSKDAVPANAATIGTNLVQVTSITSGNQYVITGANNTYALRTSPTVSSGKIEGTDIASVPADGKDYLWTFTKSDNYWLIGDGSNYIYHSNGGASGTDLTYGTSQASYPWSLTYSEESQNHWTFIGVVASTSTVGSRGMLYQKGTVNKFGGYSLTNETASDYGYMNIYEVAAQKTAATINGANSVDVGSQWSPTSITEDVSGNVVTGATYSFAASGGATISSSSTANGTFTCSSAGTVVVSATKSGYEIDSKTVTVNSSDPYINLTLTSGADAYTGQTVNITSEYGNGVAGLKWTVESGSVSDELFSNDGYSAKVAGSNGTLTIRATDTGSELYEEISITITKVTLTLNTSAITIRQGKTSTLVATHNASDVGGVTWQADPDNSKVSVSDEGVVSVASDAIIDSTATITATSTVDPTVSATCVVTVDEKRLAYEICFGSTKNTNPSELTTVSFLERFSVDNNVNCSNITKMYATNSTNQLKVGTSNYSASITLSIPTNQYFTCVEAVIASGLDLNLQVKSGASGSTLEAQNVATEGTYTFDKNLASEESNIVTISTSKKGVIYLTALNLYYAVKTPTITADKVNHEIFSNEQAVSEITISNFITTPTLDYDVLNDESSVSSVTIGELLDNKATITIIPTAVVGTPVVRIIDSDNPTLYYVDITVDVKMVPSHYMVLDAYTDTGVEYGYNGGNVNIDVTDSNLAGDIIWEVTSGSVLDENKDNDSYTGMINCVGTLTIVATDEGDSTNTRTVTINVVDSLNSVTAKAETPGYSELIFESAANGSGTAKDGATWTVSSNASESTYESERGIHFGTGDKKVQDVTLVSENAGNGANKTIKSVIVNASDATGTGALTVSVGSSHFHCNHKESTTVQNTKPGLDYTFVGSATGTVTVKIERETNQVKAIYVKSIVVNYVTEGDSEEIANAVDMHLAQKAVIEYANDFNRSLEAICVGYGSTNVTELTNAWETLANQYDDWFNKGVKDLNMNEVRHAKRLFSNALFNEDGDELQKMLAKYNEILSNYELLDFLNTDPGTGRDPVSPSRNGIFFNTIFKNNNSVAIIITVSLVSLTVIGGYFFFHKKKEQ